MTKLGLLLVGVSLAFTAFAEVQTFNCYANGEIVLIAVVNDDGKTGTIQVAGTTFETEYVVEGINRRWDWVLNERNTYTYVLVITPGGIGVYKDFSSPKASEYLSQYFKCAME